MQVSLFSSILINKFHGTCIPYFSYKSHMQINSCLDYKPGSFQYTLKINTGACLIHLQVVSILLGRKYKTGLFIQRNMYCTVVMTFRMVGSFNTYNFFTLLCSWLHIVYSKITNKIIHTYIKLVNSVTSCFNTLQNKTISIRHNTIGRIQVIFLPNKCQVSNGYQS